MQTTTSFFYRRLRFGARPVDHSADSIVSAADCRLSVFSTVEEATRIWIKGNSFSLSSLFKNDEMGRLFDGGSLGIFRLAPQDYHRFHTPVNGTIVNTTYIDGTYYSVNPMIVKQPDLNVFTENKRTVTLLNTTSVGEVAYVSVGAMLVGSVVLTGAKDIGQDVVAGDELGYFAFGGSTIILVFKKNMMAWDADLLENSEKGLEVLVQMGERVGRVVNPLAGQI